MIVHFCKGGLTMKLFCLPYAGSSGATYYQWRKYFDHSITLTPVVLKGRGNRISESFYQDIHEAVGDVYNFVKQSVNKDDYAIFGHSMGGLLAYELYYKLRSMNHRLPKHIFCSGVSAPSTREKREQTHTLPDDEFLKKYIKLGGIQQDVINNKELLDMFIPILRKDCELVEKYEYVEREGQIECDITILNGSEENMKPEEIIKWKQHVSGMCNIYTLTGDHFFINDNVENITDLIKFHLLN